MSAIVVTARNNFKDREPHESNVRELLRQVEYLDVRLKPENVFEDNAFPIFDPETPQKISQHDTPTADVDTVAELKAMMRDNDSAGKPIQETILNLRKLNDVPQPVSLRRSISTIDALLEIFGTNLSRVNGFDLKNLMDDDPSTYAVTKSKVLNLIHRSHRSYLKNKHREDEVLTLLDHISRITHDNEWLAQP